jgi:hypothetical protein
VLKHAMTLQPPTQATCDHRNDCSSMWRRHAMTTQKPSRLAHHFFERFVQELLKLHVCCRSAFLFLFHLLHVCCRSAFLFLPHLQLHLCCRSACLFLPHLQAMAVLSLRALRGLSVGLARARAMRCMTCRTYGKYLC